MNFPRADTFHSETKLIVSSNANVDGLPLVITLGSEFGQQDQSTNFRVPVLLPHWIEKASPSISVTSYGTSRFSIHVMISFVDHQSWRFAFSSINGNGSFSITQECVWIHRRWYVLANQFEISYYYFMVSNFFLHFDFWLSDSLNLLLLYCFQLFKSMIILFCFPSFHFLKISGDGEEVRSVRSAPQGPSRRSLEPPNGRFHSLSPSLLSYCLIV